MKKIFWIVGALIIGSSFMALLIGGFIVPRTWNYKITIEVETPEGIKTGSAVRQVRAWREIAGYINPGSGIVTYDVIGEAVVVDLGERGLLFGLIDDTDYVLLEFAFDRNASAPYDNVEFFSHLPVGTTGQALNFQPKLVIFENRDDPKTVKLVYINQKTISSERYKDNFSEVYGDGVHLKAVTVQITDSNPTKTVKKYLPSFGSETGFSEWFRTLGYEDSRKIGPYNFVRGEKW